jgi:hypothetical protein
VTSKNIDDGNDDESPFFYLWHPEAAHRSQFWIPSVAEGKHLGTVVSTEECPIETGTSEKGSGRSMEN